MRRRKGKRSSSTTCRPTTSAFPPASARRPPRSILVLPLIFEGQVRGVLELASFEGFNPTHQAFLDQLTESIGIVLNTIEANMRTEDLLKQSQSLAQQLANSAGGTAEDERRPAGKSPPAGQAKRGSRTQKRGSRAGPPGARRKGQPARPHFEVQVRVPGQHVARAADAAQQPARFFPTSSRKIRAAISRPSKPNSPRRSTRRATTF